MDKKKQNAEQVAKAILKALRIEVPTAGIAAQISRDNVLVVEPKKDKKS